MSDAERTEAIAWLTETEVIELYVALRSVSPRNPTLSDLEKRLERVLFTRMSIAEMEALTERADSMERL
jgi:hypothetical protein